MIQEQILLFKWMHWGQTFLLCEQSPDQSMQTRPGTSSLPGLSVLIKIWFVQTAANSFLQHF